MAVRPGPSSRLLGVVSMLGVVAGCEQEEDCSPQPFDPPPKADPHASVPTVLAGEWIGAGILELQFSQPVTSTADLDPDRFAILSWGAQANDYGGGTVECGLGTSYRQLGGGYYQATVAEAWIGPEDDSLLRVRLSSAASRCPTLSDTVETGVMLVYTNGAEGGPGLLDADGEPVPDIGPAWAIDQLDPCLGSDSNYFCSYLNRFATGHLPEIQSLALIPCP